VLFVYINNYNVNWIYLPEICISVASQLSPQMNRVEVRHVRKKISYSCSPWNAMENYFNRSKHRNIEPSSVRYNSHCTSSAKTLTYTSIEQKSFHIASDNSPLLLLIKLQSWVPTIKITHRWVQKYVGWITRTARKEQSQTYTRSRAGTAFQHLFFWYRYDWHLPLPRQILGPTTHSGTYFP
jgi:hypothetical protein